MAEWRNASTITKMAMVRLNSSNNFTVDLNTLGFGSWDANRTRLIPTISKMELNQYNAGYEIKTTRPNGTSVPIYKLTVDSTRATSTFVESSTTSSATWNLTARSDCAYMVVAHSSSYWGPHTSASGIKLTANGTVKYDISRTEGVSRCSIIPKDPHSSLVISAIGYGSLNRYLCSVKQYLLETYTMTDCEINCLFIEEDA